MPPRLQEGQLMSDIDNATFNAIVTSAISAETTEARKRHVDEALMLLHTTETLRKWAQSIAKSRGYRDAHGVADIEQVIAEKVLVTLRGATPEKSDRITDWLSFLHGASVRAVRDYLSSSEVTIASRMSGVMKRRDIIRRTQREFLAAHGRQPTQTEVIDAANAWAREHHKDAKKQGLLLSVDDFANVSSTVVSLDEVPTAGESRHHHGEETAEAKLALQRIREVAEDLFPEDLNLLLVTAAWVELIAGAERPSQNNITSATSLPATVVRSSLARLNIVLDEVRGLFS